MDDSTEDRARDGVWICTRQCTRVDWTGGRSPDHPLPTVDAQLTIMLRNDIGPKLEPRSYSLELQKEWDYKSEELQMAKMNIRGRQLLRTLIEYFKPWELGEGFFTMTDLMKTAIRADPKHCEVADFWDRRRKVGE